MTVTDPEDEEAPGHTAAAVTPEHGAPVPRRDAPTGHTTLPASSEPLGTMPAPTPGAWAVRFIPEHSREVLSLSQGHRAFQEPWVRTPNTISDTVGHVSPLPNTRLDFISQVTGT